jgi:putative heme iron utilization protein
MSKTEKQLLLWHFLETKDDEITDIVSEFQQKGYAEVLAAIPNHHPFDEYVLKHIFEGINGIEK